MTYNLATLELPLNAAWSCSFGYPGEGGYVEYYRTESGERWTISNGPYNALKPFLWECQQAFA